MEYEVIFSFSFFFCLFIVFCGLLCFPGSGFLCFQGPQPCFFPSRGLAMLSHMSSAEVYAGQMHMLEGVLSSIRVVLDQHLKKTIQCHWPVVSSCYFIHCFFFVSFCFEHTNKSGRILVCMVLQAALQYGIDNCAFSMNYC